MLQGHVNAIASDMPVGLVVPDGAVAQEGIAQGRTEALGRELEIARLLSSVKADRLRNVVWFTADVHCTAARHHDPARARFTDFEPFWEFVSGPLHAGTFGPNVLDPTFGPEVRFQRTTPTSHRATAAVNQLLTDAATLHACATAARRAAVEYGWPVLAGKVLEVYRSVLPAATL